MGNNYFAYLNALRYPFKKLAKIEFLQPDNSVAFELGNSYKRGYNSPHDSRAFIQSGDVSVSMQNGARRRASLTLSNLDDAFDFSVNKIWFGKRVRISMGLKLPDGSDIYFPQGVFYFKDPQKIWNPTSRTMSYSLVDKWSYLDGSLFGTLPYSYTVPVDSNVYDAAAGLLQLSTKDYSNTSDPNLMIDNVSPVFTKYHTDAETYTYVGATGTESTNYYNKMPYELTEGQGSTIAKLLLGLNTTINGLIGYDPTGALRIDPSQDDIEDTQKPILWDFSTSKMQFCGLSEASKNTEVFNDVWVIGDGKDENVWARAMNVDPQSDTNVNLIGDKPYFEKRADIFYAEQCRDLASWLLKRKTILQKSISISSSQMFHLTENSLITVRRDDKVGSPIERHLIQSFTLPLGETGEMTINATSVNDIPDLMTITSNSSQT